MVRPGFDSNIATDNRLKPNEMEEYAIEYDTKGAASPLTVTYKVYYLKRANGQFEKFTGENGFLKPGTPAKAAIYEVASHEEVVH